MAVLNARLRAVSASDKTCIIELWRGQSVDLPAPLEQNDMRVTLKSGVSLLLHVDSRCENITGFAAESCDSNKKPPRIKFSPQSSHTFWFNITGLEPGEHCVMIKATGIRVVGKYAVFNITVQCK